MIFGADEKWAPGYTKEISLNSITYRITSTLLIAPTCPPEVYKLTITALQATGVTSALPISCLEGHLLPKSSILSFLQTYKVDEDIHRNLRHVFDHDGLLRNEIVEHHIRKGTGVWGHELGTANLVFVNYIWTAVSQRNQGTASQMVEILKEVTKNHNVEYIIMQPSRFGAAAVWKADADENWRPWHNPDTEIRNSSPSQNFCEYNPKYRSHDDSAVDRSQRFWRMCGARRIGLTPVFGIAIEEKHAANLLARNEDVEERGLKPRYVCMNDEKHEYEDCKKKASLANSAEKFLINPARQIKPSELDRHLAELGHDKMLEKIKESYEYQPLVHIAINQRRVDTIRWFRENLVELFDCINYEGLTAAEFLVNDIEMCNQRRVYGEQSKKDYEYEERKNHILRLLSLEGGEVENRDEEFENFSDFSDSSDDQRRNAEVHTEYDTDSGSG